jgi:putative transposase
LAWHRKLIAQKYDGTAQRGPGRPRTAVALETLVVRLAEENRDWGCRRIQGALSNLGHEIARSTIAEILERHGIEPAPERSRKTTANGLWMSQIGRNLSDAVHGMLNGKRYLIHDRDPLFTSEFLEMLAHVGVKSVKLPPRSPNLNAHAERFVRTIKESCLERMIMFGEESLRTAIHNFIAHYHSERNQSAQNRPIWATQARSNGASAWAAC